MDDRIFRAQIQLLRDKNATVLLGNIGTSGLLVVLLWPTVDHVLSFAWFGAHLLLSVIRHELVRLYDRRANPEADVRPWAWVFCAGSAVSGVLWGLLAVIFLEPGQVNNVVLITLAIGGMCAASLGAISVHAPSQHAFAITSIGLAIASFLWKGYPDIAALTVVFLVANLVFSRLINRSIRSSLEFRFENEELLSALKEQHQLAERANQDKSDLLAAASHDLRQPVHAMGFFVDALEAQTLAPEAMEIVSRIKRSLVSLDGLFHSLLEMSRLEAGVIDPERQAVRLEPVLVGLIEEFRPLAERRDLRLEHVKTSVAIESDPVLIERMLRNLISNAIRYTRHGGVVLGVRRRGDRVAIEIRDTGPGMTDKECSDAFKAFHRLEQQTDVLEPEDGLGLGLAIVRHLSRLLDHPLEIQSSPGRGSAFRVLVKKTEPQQADMPLTLSSGPMFRGCRVLVVDDDPNVCDALEASLKSWGCSVKVASTPDDAIAACRSEQDAIIADYQISHEITGTELMRQIERELGRAVPILLITGDTAPERLGEARAAGYLLLRKPVSPANLRIALHSLLDT